MCANESTWRCVINVHFARNLACRMKLVWHTKGISNTEPHDRTQDSIFDIVHVSTITSTACRVVVRKALEFLLL